MHTLSSELQRLYFLPEQSWWRQPAGAAGSLSISASAPFGEDVLADCLAGQAAVALALVGPAATVRTMVLTFRQADAWARVASLYRALQSDLALPAPALSVSGRAGYRLWLSLAEPLPLAQARRFLNALQQKYLADLPIADLELLPAPISAEPDLVRLPPALHAGSGRWSAFIDPSMGSMFIDEAGLEMAPSLAKQADMLAGLDSIASGDFEQALALLETAPPTVAAPIEREAAASQPGSDTADASERLSVGGHFSDPQSFLLAVMNDPTASARQRIRAAKALLPYFAARTPE
jgi:hypothetical protein